jgi:hypothetical protein
LCLLANSSCATFVVDFLEQLRVLDRQRRLRGKGFHQVDGVRAERAGRAAADHQQADDVVAGKQRRGQPGAVTCAQHNIIDGRARDSPRSAT